MFSILGYGVMTDVSFLANISENNGFEQMMLFSGYKWIVLRDRDKTFHE